MRRYSNLAGPLSLISGVNSSAPTLSVSSTAGYPEVPFQLSIDRGTPQEEVCLCTARGASSFTVTRGVDGTTAVAHDPGAIVEHVVSAVDYKDAGIVRITTVARDALLLGETWEGRLIWNSTTGRFEFRDTQGPADYWAELMPVGMVIPFAGSTAPNGWLFCQGQLLSRAEYNRLFDVIGETYGVGDGSSTFAIPNLREKFPLGRHTTGAYSTLGQVGGSIAHTHTGPSHTHTGPSHSHSNPNTQASSHAHAAKESTGASHDPSSGGVAYIYGTPNVVQSSSWHTHVVTIPSGGSHAHTQGATNPGGTGVTGPGGTGATGPANPPYIVLNYLIRV